MHSRSLLIGKIEREVVRIVTRTWQLPLYIVQRAFFTLYYDIFMRRRVKVHGGSQSPGKKVAVYVIYPKEGVKPSHLASLKYLIGAGYSPLLVSNLELDDAPRSELLRWSWLLIERPNIGYDFGGYREAILKLNVEGREVERLALFNDSCWFPIPANSSWLAKAELTGKDLVGSVSNRFIHPRLARTMKELLWSYNEGTRGFHYCSFALLLSGRVTQDPRFVEFWRRYPLLGSKRHVVRHGEVGLTKWIMRRGYTHGSTVKIQHLDEELESMTCRGLQKVLRNMVSPLRTELVQLKHELLEEYEDCETWRNKVIPFMLFLAYRGPSCYSLPDHLIRVHDFGFLKKATARSNEDALCVLRELAQRHKGQCGFDLQLELEELGNLGKVTREGA